MEHDRRAVLALGLLGAGAAAAPSSAARPALGEAFIGDPYRSVAVECAGQSVQVSRHLGLHPSKAYGQRTDPGPPIYSRTRQDGLVIDRNVAVTLRDGVRIYIDLYRPEAPAPRPLATLVGWSPYGKHSKHHQIEHELSGFNPAHTSKHAGVEAPDPAYWCRHGYAVAYADPRGSWHSEGEQHFLDHQEATDAYDLIEWLGVQPWSNGKVGMAGVSYLTMIQWPVAALRPPHLAAINPWEGSSDIYREIGYHGGMLDTGAVAGRDASMNYSLTRTENIETDFRLHPLIDCYWLSKRADLGRIQVPAFVAASWGDHGIHTRGTIEGYRRISSPQKWLHTHGQKKWSYYYEPDAVALQRQFFDHFLLGRGDAVLAWPKVQVFVRKGGGAGVMRDEPAWPIARTELRKLYLDASLKTLAAVPSRGASHARYPSLAQDGGALFDHLFEQETEITGNMKLRLWVEPAQAEDMDLFVGIQKFDAAGREVTFFAHSSAEDAPVALGWLRASHRELDPRHSTPDRPIHAHRRKLMLKPGEPVAVEIEIWPSSTIFARGERLRVLVKGVDVYGKRPSKERIPFHIDTCNHGDHIIHTGGRFDSHLLVPVVAT